MEKELEVDDKGLNHEKSLQFFLNPDSRMLFENKEKIIKMKILKFYTNSVKRFSRKKRQN